MTELSIIKGLNTETPINLKSNCMKRERSMLEPQGLTRPTRMSSSVCELCFTAARGGGGASSVPASQGCAERAAELIRAAALGVKMREKRSRHSAEMRTFSGKEYVQLTTFCIILRVSTLGIAGSCDTRQDGCTAVLF